MRQLLNQPPIDRRKAAILLVVLVAFIILAPSIVSLIGGGIEKLKPPAGAAKNATRFVEVEKPVYVASSMPLSEKTRTYGSEQMHLMIADITMDTRIATKGSGRAATPDEFTEFCSEFKNNSLRTKAVRGIDTVDNVFWGRNDVWAGYMVTKKNHRTFVLVLVMAGGKPAFAKIDVLSDDPANEWSVWQTETDKTEESVTGIASQVFLAAGGE